MAYSAESYYKRCFQAAERFVQTVVVIDNEAEFGNGVDRDAPRTAQRARTGLRTEAPLQASTEGIAATVADSTIESPVNGNERRPEQALAVAEPGGVAVMEPQDAVASVNRHKLDAKALTDAFSDRSVLCTVYRPAQGEEMVDRAARLASHADIVVIDWYLELNSSATAKEIISRVLHEDTRRNGRLRLIAIYTAEGELSGLAKELREFLASAGLAIEAGEEGSVLRAPGLRILFLQKAQSELSTGSEGLPVAELPSRLIQEYAGLSAGILSIVALHAIAAIREGTHHILSTFHPELDGAFVVHRCLLPHPEDAEGFAVNLIAAEIGSLLEAHNVGAYACADVKKDWIASRKKDAKGFPIGNEFVSAETLQAHIDKGIEAGVLAKKSAHKKISEALYGSEASARKYCLELGRISSLKREMYSNRFVAPEKPPILCVGSIVRPLANEDGRCAAKLAVDDYLLCMQPACDSVRVKDERAYPFLRLSKGDRFNIAVKTKDGETIGLQISAHPYLTEMLRFKPSEADGFVVAKLVNKSFVFTDADGYSYEWLADLNEFTAQWAVTQVGNRLNTPGLDHFEWLRLQS